MRRFPALLALSIFVGGSASIATAQTSIQKPDVKSTAEAFVKEVVADTNAAENTYKDKLIELTGTVSSADAKYDKFGLTLNAGKLKPTDASGLFVECEVPEDQREKVWLLGSGQKVQVTGVLVKIAPDRIRLTKCEVKELEPNPLPKVKSTDLAAAYAKTQKEAEKKYGEQYSVKQLFLEGTVLSTKAGEYGTLVDLEGSGKIGVRVQIDSKEAEGLKKGDKVSLKATGRGYWPAEGAVLLQGRILPPAKEKDKK